MGVRRSPVGRSVERAYFVGTLIATALALAAVGYVIYRTFQASGRVWDEFGIVSFVTGPEWIPFRPDGDPVFGALPFIYGTITTSLLALAIAVPVALAVALATTVFLPRRLRAPLAAIVDVLAAVPSVVFGLWAVLVLVPVLEPALTWLGGRNLGIGLLAGPASPQNYLTAGLVLAIMILPIIAAISREVLATVPVEQEEAAYALGLTKWEMVRSSMLPWARSGIVGASALGLGRAVGETIALAAVLGNSPNVFGSLLGPGSTLASVIALQFGEADDLQLSALIGLAVVLFVIAFIINMLARLIVSRSGTSSTSSRPTATVLLDGRPEPSPPAWWEDADEYHRALVRLGRAEGEPPQRPAAAYLRRTAERLTQAPRISARRIWGSRLATVMIFGAVALALLPLVAILGKVLIEGLPPLIDGGLHPARVDISLGPLQINNLPVLSNDFIASDQPADAYTPGGGVRNALVGTLLLMLLGCAVAVPAGILTALFLFEARAQGPLSAKVADTIGFVVDVLLGVPSIVAGFLIYIVIVLQTQQFSIWAGGLSLAFIMFPIVVRSADEIFRLVPAGQIEAALALGAPRWRTTLGVVLPIAAPGLLTGAMLAFARAAGETAPLLLTSGANQFFSTDFNEPVSALPILIFRNLIEILTPESERLAWGAALVLILLVVGINLLARLLARFTTSPER